MEALPSSDAAAGLDPALAQEVATDPVIADKLAGSDDEQAALLYQNNVVLYGYCRDVANSYQAWITTGTPAPIGELAVPTTSLDPETGERANRALLKSYYDDAIASGDPDELRRLLGDELICADVPVAPGEFSGDRFAVYRQPGEEH